MLPLVWLALLFGYMVGHWEAGIDLQGIDRLAVAVVAWTALHAGTLWLNAARDRDEGPVLFGRSVRVPPGIVPAGYIALLVCVGFSLIVGGYMTAFALLAVLLSVGYSHPAVAWKGHPIGGPAVNMLGYGVLTPLAGLVAAMGGVGLRTLVFLLITLLAMGALTFAAQAFQQDEDRARGDRTLVATHGPRGAILGTRILLGSALVLTFAGCVWGLFPRICLVGMPWAWESDRYLGRWANEPNGGTPAHARGLIRRMLVLMVVLVVAAVSDYVWGQLHGTMPAGMSTAVVPSPWFVFGP